MLVLDTNNPCLNRTRTYYQNLVTESSRQSFREEQEKLPEDFQQKLPNAKLPLIIIGSQIDKRRSLNEGEQKGDKSKDGNNEPITFKQGLSLAKELGAVGYVECSSLLGIGIQDVEDEIFRTLHYDSGRLNGPR